MLVIHGDRDYRVPIGEALRLWSELAERRRRRRHDAAQVPLLPRREPLGAQPQHAKIWYTTVLAFLDHHVHGADWEAPELLR